MTVAIIIYFIVLIGFLVTGGLIVRHSIKFNYLSARFKTVVISFATIALTIIIFSIFLMFQGNKSSDNTYYEPYTESSSSSTSSGDLNF